MSRAAKTYMFWQSLTAKEIKMKLIIAIIQPHKLEEVKEALYAAEVNLITVSEVLGHGRQKGVTEVYRGVKETGNLLRKIRLEIAVNDNFLEPTISAIMKGARTGETGDGKIFILDLKDCIRIRTGEKGGVAIG
jgi:nitrogen regulatory protein P-II 2